MRMSNLPNIKECERCRKTMIEEEFPNHVCTPYLTGIKEIIIDYFYETVTKDGDRKIVAFGLDGRIYDLIQCRHNPLHKSKNPNLTFATRRPLTERKSDRDLPEPKNSFFILPIVSLRVGTGVSAFFHEGNNSLIQLR